VIDDKTGVVAVIEQEVIVKEATDEYLILSPLVSGCSGCHEEGCGVSSLANLFGRRERLLCVNNPGCYQAGEVLVLHTDSILFIKGVLLQYLLPLFTAMSALIVAGLLGFHVPAQAALWVFGLGLGIIISRRLILSLESRTGGNMYLTRQHQDDADGSKVGIHVLTP